jgi:hypothetical protein
MYIHICGHTYTEQISVDDLQLFRTPTFVIFARCSKSIFSESELSKKFQKWAVRFYVCASRRITVQCAPLTANRRHACKRATAHHFDIQLRCCPLSMQMHDDGCMLYRSMIKLGRTNVNVSRSIVPCKYIGRGAVPCILCEYK